MKVVPLLGAAVLAAGLVGCGGMKYVDITKGTPIAVVGFSLDNSIVEEGKERDSGPGLLQKKDNYYRPHKEAVNALWADFKGSYRDLFLGAEVQDVEAVAANEKYSEMTKHVPKMIMGTDIAPGSNALTADGGLNYVGSTDGQLLEKLATELNAKLVMGIDYSASYKMSTGVQLGPLSGGAAVMTLRASVFLYEKGNGIVMRQSFTEDSDEKFPMVQGIMVSDNYAKGLSSAQKKLLPEIKAYFEMSKTKANEVASK